MAEEKEATFAGALKKFGEGEFKKGYEEYVNAWGDVMAESQEASPETDKIPTPCPDVTQGKGAQCQGK